MREADLLAVHEVNLRAFADLDRRRGTPYPGAAPDPAVALLRLRRLLEARSRRRLGGRARRGGRRRRAGAAARGPLGPVAALSSIRTPRATGAGRELLARPTSTANGARGHVILSSSDPRAMRAYARLGLELHPADRRHRRPAGRHRRPLRCRPGGPDDLALTEAVDRAVRGAAHGEDVLSMLQGGHELLVAPGARLRDAARGARSACWAPSTTTAPARSCAAPWPGSPSAARAPTSSSSRSASSGRSTSASTPGWTCRPIAAACSPVATSDRSRPTFPAGRTCERCSLTLRRFLRRN